MSKSKFIYRSAKTGRLVTEKWALRHPATTVREEIRSNKKEVFEVKKKTVPKKK